MEGQVPEDIKLERTQAAMDLAESLGFAATAARVGEVAEVIVDGIEETDEGPELIGHAWFQAPTPMARSISRCPRLPWAIF